MEQLGHSDPKLALQVYAGAMGRSDEECEALRVIWEGVSLDSNGQ
jgi:hypothetical protein